MYKEIIERESQKLPQQYNWWPRFFYHFSDVNNIVSILKTGWLYSREKAEQKQLMINDNASSAVIRITSSGADRFARLYFRPKTPTQYHNEGYKPVEVRNQEINACCPIPVFMLFDANEMLKSKDVFFSEKTLAGNSNSELLQGVDNYSTLPFDKIFHVGYYNTYTNPEIKQHRMAEVVVKGGLEINKPLRRIVCRTIAEKQTLLYLLSQESKDLYQQYKNIIRYNPELDMFYNNGIYIKEVIASEDKLQIILNPPNLRYKYDSVENVIVNTEIVFRWLDSQGRLVNVDEFSANTEYNTTYGLSIKLDRLYSTHLEVEVTFNDNLMFYGSLSFEDENHF